MPNGTRMSASVPDTRPADPVSPTVQRLVALSGIFFTVLIVLSILFLGDEPPDYDEPVAKWTAWAKDNDDGLRVFLVVFSLATYNFVLFLGYLRSVMGGAEGAVRGFVRGGYVILAGGAVGIAGIGTGLSLIAASAQLTDSPPDIIRAMNFIGGGPFMIGAGAMGACLVTVGLLNAALRALPAWLGWVALASGVSFVLVIGSVLSDPGDDNVFGIFFPIAFLLLIVFTAGASVNFVRGLGRGAPSHAPQPPPV